MTELTIINNHNPTNHKFNLLGPLLIFSWKREKGKSIDPWKCEVLSLRKNHGIVWHICSKRRMVAGFFAYCVSNTQSEIVFERTWLVFLDLLATFLPECTEKKSSWSLDSRWRHCHQPTSPHSSDVRGEILRNTCRFKRRDTVIKRGPCYRNPNQRKGWEACAMAGTEYIVGLSFSSKSWTVLWVRASQTGAQGYVALSLLLTKNGYKLLIWIGNMTHFR